MIRNIEQYRKLSPARMAQLADVNHRAFAIEELRQDILELYKQNEKLKEVARMIGYPEEISEEFQWDYEDASQFIRSNFTLEELDQ